MKVSIFQIFITDKKKIVKSEFYFFRRVSDRLQFSRNLLYTSSNKLMLLTCRKSFSGLKKVVLFSKAYEYFRPVLYIHIHRPRSRILDWRDTQAKTEEKSLEKCVSCSIFLVCLLFSCDFYHVQCCDFCYLISSWCEYYARFIGIFET